MTLEVITGSANAGKTGVILGAALESAAAGESPILVVPTLGDARRLEAELAVKAPLGVRVATFESLLAELWMLHGDGRRFVDSHTREAVVEAALAAQGDRRAGLTGSRGCRRLVSGLVQRPGDLHSRASAGRWARVLCQVVRSYQEMLGRDGLIEASHAETLLGAAAPLVGGVLGALRFDMLEERHAAFLVAMARSNQVMLGLTWEPGLPSTVANEGAVAWLRAHGAALRPATESEATAIAQFGRSMGGPPAGLSVSADIRFWGAAGREGECALAVDAAQAAIAQGVPAERICVAFPDLDRRREALAAAFAAKGVPADPSVGARVSTTAYGRALRSLVRLASPRGTRADANLLAAGPFSGLDATEARRLDVEWRRWRMEAPDRLLRDIEHAAGDSSRARVALKAARLLAHTGGLSEWKKLAELLAAVVLDNGEAALQRQTAAAFSAVDRMLGEIDQAAGAMSLDDVLDVVEKQRLPGRSEEPLGEVQLSTLDEIGARRFDVLVIGGLNDDEFGPATESPFAEEIDDTSDMPPAADPIEELRLRFYSAVTRARYRLVLVRQESDVAGRGLRPSVVWSEAIDVFRPVNRAFDEGFERGLVSRRQGQADLPSIAPVFTEGRDAERTAVQGLAFGEPERAVVTGGRKSAEAGERPFSATEIETYLQCPYRWFYDRVIRPEELDRELDGRALGTYAHELLKATYQKLAADGVKRVTDATLGRALKTLDATIEVKRQTLSLDGSLEERLATQLAEVSVRALLVRDADFLPGFAPSAVEVVFGQDEAPFEFGGARIAGRIDRIDTSGELLFVTDYKLSRSVTPLRHFEREGKVQAILYALAVESSMGLPVVGSAYRSLSSGRLGGFWRADLLGEVPDGLCDRDVLGAAGFDELAERTEARVAAAVEGMRAGRTPRKPQVKSACQYCALKRVCEGANR